ncbi:hypothetical protein PTSG_04560 [Salpingoeca rosetta]|uniref:Uncharacterized protein n=1 Tax=Salpingoeca rosetta (strain ATCC 50818 / BSB-021) TaxID=946362 RepID=F2U7S6_SALR5|nr:uncharacterized protein PTSG_04560 [Salpingoeca rosetta]EGD72831.1 hypothetical protein PTSG_04560 [Salpingoeca rosetta]|eukprot:XP_004994654.1 hypothetical protein PTSG_04560 [Salpingoeca rosetta]
MAAKAKTMKTKTLFEESSHLLGLGLKQGILFHDINAGQPCFKCGDACPGFELHFWRKSCRHCKCSPFSHEPVDQAQEAEPSVPQQQQVGQLSDTLRGRFNAPVVGASERRAQEISSLVSGHVKRIRGALEHASPSSQPAISRRRPPPQLPQDAPQQQQQQQQQQRQRQDAPQQMPPPQQQPQQASRSSHGMPLPPLPGKQRPADSGYVFMTPSSLPQQKHQNQNQQQQQLQPLAQPPMAQEYDAYLDVIPEDELRQQQQQQQQSRFGEGQAPPRPPKPGRGGGSGGGGDDDGEVPQAHDGAPPYDTVTGVGPRQGGQHPPQQHQQQHQQSQQQQQEQQQQPQEQQEQSAPARRTTAGEVDLLGSKNVPELTPDLPLAWKPEGLSNEEAVDFFKAPYPLQEVPVAGTDGERRFLMELEEQLPAYDFDPEFCSGLTPAGVPEFEALLKLKVQSHQLGQVSRVKMDSVCYKCRQPLHANDMQVTMAVAPGERYHPWCFRCDQCDRVLAGLNAFVHDDGLLCERHFSDKYKARCAACDESIYETQFVQAEDQAWHVDHFCCFACDVPVHDKPYIPLDGQPHCSACFNKQFVPQRKNKLSVRRAPPRPPAPPTPDTAAPSATVPAPPPADAPPPRPQSRKPSRRAPPPVPPS